MYKSLSKIYFIFIKFFIKEKKRRCNIFSLIFDFYNNEFKDIYNAFKLKITTLNHDLNIKINNKK